MAPPQLFNRVKLAVASAPGSGAIALGAAISGYRTFAQAGATSGLVVNYLIEDGTAWEYGRGTWSSTGPTLARTTILGSSNSGAAINASAAAVVSCDAFAEDLTNQANLIATSGDLAASPAAMITFLGLGGYSDLFFDFNNVTNDYSSAQTHSAAFTVDGTNWTNSATITSSTASSNFLKGQVTLFGNNLGCPILQAIFAASNNAIPVPSLATTLSNLVRVAALAAGTPVTGIRFFPTTGGNYNRGNIVAWGR